MPEHSAEIETAVAAVVTCPPGYFVLRPPGIEKDEKHLRRVAVVAWRVIEDKAIPVTADPPLTSEELDYAVEFPDGHVEAENTSWVSVDQYCTSNGLGPVELLDE